MSGIGKIKLVGLDSNVFIYHFEQNSQFTRYTELIFQKLMNNKLKAVTSVLSLTEALAYPSPPEVIEGIKTGFATAINLTIAAVSQEIAIEAAGIRREYGFKLPDAVQLATAISGKAQAFITNGHRLKYFKKLKIISLQDLK